MMKMKIFKKMKIYENIRFEMAFGAMGPIAVISSYYYSTTIY